MSWMTLNAETKALAAQTSKIPRIRVAALILVDGRIVVVRHRRKDSCYHLLPGGGVEWGETLEQALFREVAEETGLRVQVGRVLLVSDTIDPNGNRHVVNVVFEAEVSERPTVMTSRDRRVEAVEMIAPEELAGLDLRPPVAKQLLQSLSSQGDASQIYIGPVWISDEPESLRQD